MRTKDQKQKMSLGVVIVLLLASIAFQFAPAALARIVQQQDYLQNVDLDQSGRVHCMDCDLEIRFDRETGDLIYKGVLINDNNPTETPTPTAQPTSTLVPTVIVPATPLPTSCGIVGQIMTFDNADSVLGFAIDNSIAYTDENQPPPDNRYNPMVATENNSEYDPNESVSWCFTIEESGTYEVDLFVQGGNIEDDSFWLSSHIGNIAPVGNPFYIVEWANSPSAKLIRAKARGRAASIKIEAESGDILTLNIGSRENNAHLMYSRIVLTNASGGATPDITPVISTPDIQPTPTATPTIEPVIQATPTQITSIDPGKCVVAGQAGNIYNIYEINDGWWQSTFTPDFIENTSSPDLIPIVASEVTAGRVINMDHNLTWCLTPTITGRHNIVLTVLVENNQKNDVFMTVDGVVYEVTIGEKPNPKTSFAFDINSGSPKHAVEFLAIENKSILIDFHPLETGFKLYSVRLSPIVEEPAATPQGGYPEPVDLIYPAPED